MTTFAVGDRVKTRSTHLGRPLEGTITRILDADDPYLITLTSTPKGWVGECDTVVRKANEIKKVHATFNEGDKVVAVEGNDHLDIKAGVVYTVVGSTWDEWDQATILNVESSSGRRVWADSKRFKQYVPKPQQFELRYGDKVKNLHTGRVGQVFRNSRGELYVYDTVRPIRDGVPAAAVEGYEDEYPGTYDIVFRRDSEEPW